MNSLLEIPICDGISQSSNVERADGLVLWGIQSGHSGGSFQQLVSHRIIDAIVTVLNVLVSKRVIRICGLLMPVKNMTKNRKNCTKLNCTNVYIPDKRQLAPVGLKKPPLLTDL